MTIIRNILSIWIAAVLFSPPTLANHNANIRISHLNLEDGLSQSTIYSFVQDQRGFIWLGTLDGLNKYDGRQFIAYRHNPDNPNSISHNQVDAVYEDRHGILWIGTGYGLNRFDPISQKFTRYYPQIGEQNNRRIRIIQAIQEVGDGLFWMATNGGLLFFNSHTNKFRLFAHNPNDPASIPANRVNTLLYDEASNILWVGTQKGLSALHMNTEQFTHYVHKPNDQHSISNNKIAHLAKDLNGDIWIGTAHGLNRYRYETKQFQRFYKNGYHLNGLASNDISYLFVDRSNQLWIGHDSDGLNKYNLNDQTFEWYTHDPSDPYTLAHNGVRSIYQDKNGIMWVGADGINKFNDENNPFIYYSHQAGNPNSLNDNMIRSISEDKDGILWVGTFEGLNEFDRKQNTVRHYHHNPDDPNSISGDIVRDVFVDSKQNKWVATTKGLDFISAKTHQVSHLISNVYMQTVLEDADNIIWVGSNNGLYRFNEDLVRYKNYKHIESEKSTLSDNSVRSLYQDSRGILWVGTYQGLNRYHPQTDSFSSHQSVENDPNSLSDNSVYSITEDHHGDLWLATAGGLNQYNIENNTFRHYRENDGLANDMVYSILTDELGMLWMGTNAGLSRLNPITLTFKNFDIDDGLQSNEFNSNAHHISRRTGEVFFGGINGLNAFFPQKITGNSNIPEVRITNFKIFNQTVPIDNGELSSEQLSKLRSEVRLQKAIFETDKITLSYKDSVISFEFASLDYTNPHKNQYAYKMVGFDQDWIYSGNRRFATYTNLDPGQYIFKVKGSNDDQVWNETGASISIYVTPPFWKTWWFRASLALFIILIAFTIYALRIRTIHTRNTMLEKEVKIRTAALEVQKESLQKALIELEETKDALIESAHKAGMADIATSVLHNIGNILNSVNTSASVIHDTVSNSVTERVFKANKILKENRHDMATFIAKDDKSASLFNYYIELEKPILKEREKLIDNASRLIEKINAVKDAIFAQQSQAKGRGLTEVLSLTELVEDTLRLQNVLFHNNNIHVIKEFDLSIPSIPIQKAKVVQILLNLYKNAKESMAESNNDVSTLTIVIYKDDENAYVKVTDNGHGIEADKLDDIFAYGFTTKAEGHGFGLHSCANYMTEMGGKMWVESAGLNQGASFTLKFPFNIKLEEPHLKLVSE